MKNTLKRLGIAAVIAASALFLTVSCKAPSPAQQLVAFYTVTFDINGGSGAAPGPITAEAGSPVTLPGGSGLTRSGYTFGGWNASASGTGTTYNADSSYTPTSSITLYAQWDASSATFTVIYNINGGSGAGPGEQMANADSVITLFGAPFIGKAGYAFCGWNTDPDGGGTDYSVGSSYAVTGNITLYAKWLTPEPMEMVFVPGGSFEMGKDLGTAAVEDVSPVHTVTLSGFYMGRTEVTQARYKAVTGYNPSWGFHGPGVEDDYPVFDVSWYSAAEFCNKLSEVEGLQPVYTISGRIPVTGHHITSATVTANWSNNGYRLPTEAEWEYAAKGGDGSPGNYTYAGSDDPDEVAWHGGSGLNPAGTKAPNGLGLYDMSGNVWEWCWDWFGDYSSEAQTDPHGASSGSYRVLRGGGSWWDDSAGVRSANRLSGSPSNGAYYIGFRVVRPAQ